MKIAYRLIAVSLIISLLLFALPVSAAEENKSVYNLLESDSYNRYKDGVLTYSNQGPERGATSFVQNASSVSLDWVHKSSLAYGAAFILIQSENVPSSVFVTLYSGSPVYEAQYVGTSGEYQQYRLGIGGSTSTVTVNAFYDSPYTGNWDVVSFDVLRNYDSTVDNVDFVMNQHYYSSSTGVWTYRQIFDRVNLSIPNGFSGLYTSTVDSRTDYCSFAITIDSADRSVNLADSIEFILNHYGLIYDIGLQISSSLSSSPDYVFYPDSYELTQNVSLITPGTNATIHTYTSAYRFDISGIDLTNKVVSLTGKVQTDYAGVINGFEYEAWTFRIYSIGFMLPVADIPWYQSFWYKLKNSLSDIFDINKEVSDKMDGLLSSDEDQAAADSFGDQVDQQQQAFENANNSLQSFEKPDIDSVNIGSSTIIDSNGMSVLAQPMNDIFSNPLILHILVIAATCALIGYAFFGKR